MDITNIIDIPMLVAMPASHLGSSNTSTPRADNPEYMHLMDEIYTKT